MTKNFTKIKYVIAILLFAMIVFTEKTVYASFKLNYDNKTVQYDDVEVSFMLDGKVIEASAGFIIDGTALAPCSEVFINSGMNITYKYSKAKGILILYHGKDSIKFTLGEKYAYVNNAKKSLGTPARIIKNSKTGKSKIYVPSRFVAANFGFDYEWSREDALVRITSPAEVLTINKKQIQYNNPKIKVMADSIEISTRSYYGITIDSKVKMVPCKLVFANAGIGCEYSYSSKSKKVVLKKFGKTLTMYVGKKNADVDGTKVTLSEAPVIVSFKSTGKNVLYVPADSVCEVFGFEYLDFETDAIVNIKVPAAVVVNGEYRFPEVLGSLCIDGEDIDISPYYSILENNTALIRAKKVFGTLLGCNYYYDKDTKNVVITNEKNSIIMTIDSNTAYVNGKEVTITVPPRLVLFEGTKSQIVMVPGRFVTTNLGYEYEWIADGFISNITTVKQEEPEEPDTTKADEDKKSEDKSDKNKNDAEKIKTANSIFSWKYNESLIPEGFTKDTLNQGKFITQVDCYSNGYSETLQIDCTVKPTYSVVRETAASIVVEFRDIKSLINLENFISNDPTSQIVGVFNTNEEELVTHFIFNRKHGATYYIVESGNSVRIVLVNPLESDYNAKVPFVQGTDISKISCVDDYFNKRFIFTLPGNQIDYLNTNKIITNNDHLYDTNIKLNDEGNTVVTMNFNELQTYKLAIGTDAIYLKIGNPRDIYSKIVLLDPGHGGKDPGAQYYGTDEKNLNLEICYNKMKDFFEGSDIKAYWTRKDDTFMELSERSSFADYVGADMFISLHMNAITRNTDTIYGTSVFYSPSNKNVMGSYFKSENLAKVLQYDLVNEFGMYDRKVKTAAYVVCKDNVVPACLIELGFMSNKNEYNKLIDPTFQYNAAKLIYGSIEYIFNTYSTNR